MLVRVFALGLLYYFFIIASVFCLILFLTFGGLSQSNLNFWFRIVLINWRWDLCRQVLLVFFIYEPIDWILNIRVLFCIMHLGEFNMLRVHALVLGANLSLCYLFFWDDGFVLSFLILLFG